MKSRFSALFRKMEEYLRMCGAMEYAYINHRLLAKAVVDYFDDIERLKYYEGIERINEAKIYAYQTYWLLRRKPIQIVSPTVSAEILLYLNEFILACMMISDIYGEAGCFQPG